MKCHLCGRNIELRHVKKDGMWSNHWECPEHGKIDLNSREYKAFTKRQLYKEYFEAQIEYYRVLGIENAALDAIAAQYGIKRK